MEPLQKGGGFLWPYAKTKQHNYLIYTPPKKETPRLFNLNLKKIGE